MGPFGLVGVSTTSLERAHLVVVDLVVHLVAQRVGNFSDRPWGISVILVIAIDGKSYEIDLNAKNAASLRKAFAPFIEKGRSAGRGSNAGVVRSTSSGRATLFSRLDAEEKDHFRRWADMPNARRIGDARVQAWIDAGKP